MYSWKLTPSDRCPVGKRNDISLREKEKQIQQCLDKNIISYGGNYTVFELVEKYVKQKVNVNYSTLANYNFVANVIKKETFG